jgi:soluble lytic murein transglycosylase-like protein
MTRLDHLLNGPRHARTDRSLGVGLIRFAAAALAGVLLALPAQAVHAQDPGLGPNPHHEAARIIAAELAMAQASSDLSALSAQQPTGLMETLRNELAMDRAAYAFRAAARQEQLRVYELAGYASVEGAVIPLLPPADQNPIENTIAGLHSLYILGGIDQYYLVNVHFTHPYSDAKPVNALRSYYLEAQNRYGVDASYLASINFIESNFGRINGPSSAGAEGPMQFLPSTWTEYGQGGNINDPHDSILAAARYLAHNGAPYNMRNAIYHYNLDFDYVDSVESFARAYRTDPAWLDRMYYWNTYG